MFTKRLISTVLVVLMVLVIMPTDISAYGESFISISAGGGFSLSIKADNTLWTWGANGSGQLGDGTTTNRITPMKIMDNVISISAGRSHSFAIQSDGSLWAWGDNSYGKIGDGTTSKQIIPVKILEDVVAISAGINHSMAVKSDGSLWAWGDNSTGQLGDGTTIGQKSPIKILDNVYFASAGYDHSTAITNDNVLWAWGNNSQGQLGDNTDISKNTPTKIMDDVISVSAGGMSFLIEGGGGYTMAIKTDGSLWAWGNNSIFARDASILGDGTKINRYKPVKIMDDVISVSTGFAHTMATKANGTLWVWGWNGGGVLGDGKDTASNSLHYQSTPTQIKEDIMLISAGISHSMAVTKNGKLWAWGGNGSGQLGDITTESKSLPVEIMDNVKIPSIYVYDTTDPGASVVLPIDKLADINDKSTAVSAIKSAAAGMTIEQKSAATGIDLVTLYAEEAVAQAASRTVSSGDVVINRSSVQELQSIAEDTKKSAEQALASSGITTQRELNADVKFKTNNSTSMKITVDPSAIDTTVDNVSVETPDYSVTFSADSIKANADDSPLIITITESSPTMSTLMYSTLSRVSPTDPYTGFASLVGNGMSGVLAASTNTKTYNISFNKPIEENVKVSLSPASGDPTYQAVTNSAGNAVGGKYNPVTNTLDVKVKDSDTYTVKENKKNFSDISSKSKEMQNAITILASKGIINGTSETTFNPDGTITRAEIAALITRTLSKYDANAISGFTDVKKSDWYYGAAGSAKKYGIMNGTSATTFAPTMTIPKDQITAVAARVLRIEMKYKNPVDVNKILSVYTDASSFANWSLDDLALATRENLVVKRSDGKFNPTTTMTRGDAAIILYRMFMKIW